MPCSLRYEGKGSYWSSIIVIYVLRRGLLISDPDWSVAQTTLTSLKTWMGGFSRNNKGPYLDDSMSHMMTLLFRKSRPTAVVGYVPWPTEELTQEEEDDLLHPPEEAMEADPALLVRESSTI